MSTVQNGANRLSVRGFTLVEMAVVLVIIAILVAILTPIVANYIDQARIARAQADVATIGDAISRFERDTGRYPMFGPAAAPLFTDAGATVLRLEGPGNSPTDATSPFAWTNTTSFSDPGGDCGCTTFNSLGYVLLANTPGYSVSSNLGKAFKWKGPYLDAQPDPWGRKYLVNIIHGKSGSNYALFVISAGPNGVVDTGFDISKSTAVTAVSDDIIYRIK